jgi:hypothetical protein
MIALLFIYSFTNLDPPFNFFMFLFFSLPMIGLTIQIMLSNSRLKKLNEDSSFTKSNYWVTAAIVLAVCLIYIMNFPNVIVTGIAAAFVIIIGWISAIAIYYYAGSAAITSNAKLKAILKNFRLFPKLFLTLSIITLILLAVFMGVAGMTLTRADLVIDENSIVTEETEFGYDVKVTVVNEGGMPAKGNITLGIKDRSITPPKIYAIDRIDEIESFGKWEVKFSLPGIDNATIVLFYNGEKIHEAYFYQCDIITVSMITIIGAATHRKRRSKFFNRP